MKESYVNVSQLGNISIFSFKLEKLFLNSFASLSVGKMYMFFFDA
jgi:hypothetical protein